MISVLAAWTRIVNEEEALVGNESGVAKVRAVDWSRIMVFERIEAFMLRLEVFAVTGDFKKGRSQQPEGNFVDSLLPTTVDSLCIYI